MPYRRRLGIQCLLLTPTTSRFCQLRWSLQPHDGNHHSRQSLRVGQPNWLPVDLSSVKFRRSRAKKRTISTVPDPPSARPSASLPSTITTSISTSLYTSVRSASTSVVTAALAGKISWMSDAGTPVTCTHSRDLKKMQCGHRKGDE